MSGNFYAGPERRSGRDRRSGEWTVGDSYYQHMRGRERDREQR